MDVKELGEMLRNQRESLGYSIEDLSEKTRISRRILTVFETGDVSHYPHPVYAKGFIRNYARALNLDEELCVRAVAAEFAHEDEEEVAGERRPTLHDLEEAKPVVSSGSPWLVILGCVVLVGILAGLIWYFSFSGMAGGDSAKSAAMPAELTQQSTILAESGQDNGATVESKDMSFAADVQDVNDSSVQADASSEELQTQESSASLSIQASAGEAGQPAVSGTAASNTTGLHTLIVEVVGDKPCWVGVWLPGQEDIAKDFTVPVGERIEYRFNGERLVRFGRIETVKLTFDGKVRQVKGVGVLNLSFP